MAKLVILNQGMTGRTFELNTERTTVGRVEDNAFQITDGSVSSHHAEILLQGGDIVIRDIGSTNGSYINGEKITEAVLKPGQTLRFGQVELRIDDGSPVTAPPPAPAPAAAAPMPAPTPKKVETTVVRGVSMTDLEQGGLRSTGFESNTGFAKKKNKGNLYFIVGGIVVAILIIGFIIYLISQAGGSARQ